MDVNHLKEKLIGTTLKRIWIALMRLREVDHRAKVNPKTNSSRSN